MYPASFNYLRASSVREAISMIGDNEDAKFIAGGHSLVPLMKLRLATPSTLVDIGRLTDLSYVREDGGQIAIGALTRHRDLEISPVLNAKAPIIAKVAGQVGDPSVRHKGTIGGSIAHGDGASDLPAAALALDAVFVAEGPSGRREIKSTDFHKGFLETALAPNEVLVEIRIPANIKSWSFQKFNRRAQDWAIVGVAAVKNGSTRVALINMGSTPLRAAGTESAIQSGASLKEAASQADLGLDPPGDLNATVEFRRHLAHVLVGRALEELG
ncbi:MAG: xanthine dehydrogenase family protein subunit M [Acidimicrobiaceae bacterium]|nr:xanthine dehydrogenase family protein subunit M [Acidimicrobiaceae bacterium]